MFVCNNDCVRYCSCPQDLSTVRTGVASTPRSNVTSRTTAGIGQTSWTAHPTVTTTWQAVGMWWSHPTTLISTSLWLTASGHWRDLMDTTLCCRYLLTTLHVSTNLTHLELLGLKGTSCELINFN